MKSAMFLILVGIALVVVFGLTVWPTAYRYDTINAGSADVPIVTHRVSGRRYVFDTEYGWMPLQFEEQSD